MINEINARKFCCEEISKIENYDKAIADKSKTWDCHHRLEMFWWWICPRKDLIEQGMYYNQPADRLIFLDRLEHIRLHANNRTCETKRKLSEARKGNQSGFKGKHHSEKTRRRISEAKEKSVEQYTMDGVLLARFDSQKKAALCTGISKGNISSCCKGIRKTAGGFIWRAV